MKFNCTLFLLLAIPLLIKAQPTQGWEHTLRGVTEGLSDNNIFHVFKDSRGFLWISTQNGVNRWDGYEFKTYNYNPSDTNSLSGNWVNFTLEDRSGFLWFGTYGAGLCRFDPRTEKFVRFPKSNQPNGLNSDVVTCAIQDAAGVLWLGTANGGLNRFDPATHIFSAFPKPANFNEEAAKTAAPTTRFSGPPSVHITCLLEENEHTIWLGTAFGLSRFDKRTGSFEYFFNDPQNPRSLPNNFVYDLHRSKEGEFWVQLPRAWARFDPQRSDFESGKPFLGIPSDASQGRFWEDATGSVWQCLDKGFRHWHPSHNPFQLDLGTRYPAGIFALKRIRTLLEHAGFLWIASEEGLFRCRIGESRVERFLPQGFHALLANGDMLWAASKTAGFFRIEIPTSTVYQYPLSPNGRGPTANNLIAIVQDAWGNIWLGGHGILNRFDPQSGIFSSDFFPKKPSSSILSLFFDRHKRLWVGTLSEGVFVYSFDGKGQITEAEQFRYDSKNLSSISNDIVLAIWEDRQGEMWFGTDGGLNRLPADWRPGKVAQFRRYLRSEGLADDKIMSIRDDDLGNLWIGHLSHGLTMLSPNTGKLRTFGLADGLPSTLFYWTSAWKRPDGALCFGTTEGLVAFHPDSLVVKNTLVPSVFFTEIQLFNKKLEIGKGEAPLLESPIFTPNLDFSHGQNSLTFCFAALNFVHPELNRYAYRLEPLDEDWSDLGTRHEVSFSHLPHGLYTLRVKACNNEGVWNEAGAVLQFRIRPPWWQTIWAYLLYFLLLSGGVWLLLRAQVRAAKQRLWQHFGQTLASVAMEKLPDNSGPDLEFLLQLYKLLELHIGDEYFSIEQMAKLLALSRTQLHRKTIEVTGFSAGQLLQNLRLDRARQLFAETNLTVAEVAFRCGFSDPNYFSRLFSKTQGMTPTEFVQGVRA
ncbi:MAG: helix-turn-helix domain-containing protein [Phycisphaerae bacterium]|nr:helix-turn-helix domain-containing protein [Saprospiraceae bacterium]